MLFRVLWYAISCFVSCYLVFCFMLSRVLFYAISYAKPFILLFPFAPIVYSNR
ncbi:hypothetical protein HMPREF9145_1305 [Segatella salivae F0493]|uniref:Uncharacterized protein n=1 Tax=Segatella salivae F0493 TaxID=1395125 RepID=U2L0J8_9BACT|nr:hypothetical protein HMPREF9145_1305 [Segatella salivae F0493]